MIQIGKREVLAFTQPSSKVLRPGAPIRNPARTGDNPERILQLVSGFSGTQGVVQPDCFQNLALLNWRARRKHFVGSSRERKNVSQALKELVGALFHAR